MIIDKCEFFFSLLLKVSFKFCHIDHPIGDKYKYKYIYNRINF